MALIGHAYRLCVPLAPLCHQRPIQRVVYPTAFCISSIYFCLCYLCGLPIYVLRNAGLYLFSVLTLLFNELMNVRLIILTSISVISSIIILIVILTCGDSLLDGHIGDGAIAFYLSPKVLFFIGLIRLLFTIQTSISIIYRLQELIYSGLLYVVFLIKSDFWELTIGLSISLLMLIFVAKLGLDIIKKRGEIKW